jgi:hypothetical protein
MLLRLSQHLRCLMRVRQVAALSVLLGTTVALAGTGIIPHGTGTACACGVGGPKVKVENVSGGKELKFKELEEGKKEQLVLKYTNEGPGGWNVEKAEATVIKGSATAWNIKNGVTPCIGQLIAEKTKCELLVIFEPKEEGKEYEASITTDPASETVIAKGKSEP